VPLHTIEEMVDNAHIRVRENAGIAAAVLSKETLAMSKGTALKCLDHVKHSSALQVGRQVTDSKRKRRLLAQADRRTQVFQNAVALGRQRRCQLSLQRQIGTAS
jgi:hypothetical protein